MKNVEPHERDWKNLLALERAQEEASVNDEKLYLALKDGDVLFVKECMCHGIIWNAYFWLGNWNTKILESSPVDDDAQKNSFVKKMMAHVPADTKAQTLRSLVASLWKI
eukprot:TRINITY_DN17671_c0_g1_i1.p1 TRINITY_DN17671_c0_g1~~TRINITY_DN17671_c0_g1_i1.p1  ORF type:complete len:109 (+),score=28.34 TRINITY_DN17671_c0_g1_i1:265-591(+)